MPKATPKPTEAPKPTEPKVRTKEDQEREMQANVRIIRGTDK